MISSVEPLLSRRRPSLVWRRCSKGCLSPTIMAPWLAQRECFDTKGGAPCHTTTASTTSPAFQASSKRKQGFPSETRVKRGLRVVGAGKELVEKLGRNDLCPCGSARRFQELLHAKRPLLTASSATTT